MTKLKNYREMEEYIMSVPRFTKKNTLKDTRAFYEYLGRPGKDALIVHVAGTNGKGSVCAYMDSVLRKEGISTGMFTSPHLVTLRERMRIQGEIISKEEFQTIFSLFTRQLSAYKKENGKREYHPTFFEILFFLAMIFFQQKQCRVIILETGLGGRLDATNVIDSPGVCVITQIGMDHMEYLGSDIEQIAREKAGIIKKGSRVVYSEKRQESNRVIERKAGEEGVLCKSVTKPKNPAVSFVDKRIDFSFYSRYYEYIPLQISTPALYQVENVCLALTALEESGIRLSRESMAEGIKECRWAARMEEILPGVFLDGAHNQDGISAFLSTVEADGCRRKRWLLFSAAADKEYRMMKEQLAGSGLFDKIYAVPLKNARGLKKTELEHIFLGEEVRILDSAKEGLTEILSLKQNEDLVYIAGSLYLAGEIKENWE